MYTITNLHFLKTIKHKCHLITDFLGINYMRKKCHTELSVRQKCLLGQLNWLLQVQLSAILAGSHFSGVWVESN